MLSITKNQVEQLDQLVVQEFEDRMVKHVEVRFPEQFQQLSEEQLRHVVRYGIASAAVYGITWQKQICRFLDFLFLLGLDFDTDSNMPWVQAILTDASIPDQEDRLDVLEEATRDLLGQDQSQAVDESQAPGDRATTTS